MLHVAPFRQALWQAVRKRAGQDTAIGISHQDIPHLVIRLLSMEQLFRHGKAVIDEDIVTDDLTD